MNTIRKHEHNITHPLFKPQFVEPPVDHHLLQIFRDQFGISQTVQVKKTEDTFRDSRQQRPVYKKVECY